MPTTLTHLAGTEFQMTDAKPKRHLLVFLRSEDGAVTVDWVVLAAGVLLLSVPLIDALRSPVEDGAAAIGTQVVDATD